MEPAMSQAPGREQLAGPGAGQRGGVRGEIAGAAGSGRRFLEPTSVDDVVRTEVYTAERDTTISEIVQDMRELQVGSAVVTEDDTPIGIVTDRAIALALGDHEDLEEQTAGDLIEGEVVSAMEGTDVFEVLDTMSEEGIRRIPVVDEEGTLQGIVTLDDMLLLIESKLETLTETIRSQLPEI